MEMVNEIKKLVDAKKEAFLHAVVLFHRKTVVCLSLD